MKIAMIVIRTLMGLLLLFASVSYFFNLTPPPTNMPQSAITYNEGLAIVKLMTLVKAVELICGLMFLIGRYVTLAVVLIFPIVINIVLFHGVVMPSGLGPGLFLLFGELFLAYYYRRNYAPLFAAK
ncbi:DoxX family protein [Mucilaginibacter terrenus]|uniref:DoxX family protein n=1 Tax=Mucilaginibacter terrenus TaxID=2482727 RepID=A0A3E2NPI5_9SPHI|nr:DoxX family protein [Mucilaginibacter terrenus]RFZ82909.1 DoxX family protein [Mucilaginibacter terrenus]